MIPQPQSLTANCSSLLRTMTKLLCAAIFSVAVLAQAQTLQVLYNFTGGSDGQYPSGGLTIDAAGNLYGTAPLGGNFGGSCGPQEPYSGCGTVFKLSHRGTGWTFAPLYAFRGDDFNYDGANPEGGVVFGPDGGLYGTTLNGGGGNCTYYNDGCGTAFKLSLPATVCKAALCPWNEKVIYSVARDKGQESYGNVAFDSAGNLYGTVTLGGQLDGGYVYELTPSNGQWTEQIVHWFDPDNEDCNAPMAGVLLDASGNLYGTANNGCHTLYGGVFQFQPSGSGWNENILLNFNGLGDGDGSVAALASDSHGNLYGTTDDLGPNGGGTIFELTPSDGGWVYSLVYGFGKFGQGAYPTAPVTVDASGNLYGSTGKTAVDSGNGLVFEMTPSNGAWTETVLHYFLGTDGLYPSGNVVIDAHGNLYGTTSMGGAYGYGVIWEITP
ncbi:MAG: choice-of-anchor tandem repeat GloVer-containing protein [Candidatus Korobacteraceae bacterium]